ncbi:MAG: response regulator [Opitutaceae bacterium]|nr:response regulator [Opitutaceae bacterium]
MSGTILQHAPLLLASAEPAARSLSPLAGFIGWLVALVAGLALGWIWHRAHHRGHASAAQSPSASKDKADSVTLERLPMPALAYDNNGQWHAANAASNQFFTDRQVTPTQAVPPGLAARISECAQAKRHTLVEHKCGIVWIGWQLCPLDENYVLALLTDITAQKTRETALIAERDSAAQAARMTSDFIAMLSHDIRVPMNGVLGMANLLLEAGLNQQQQELARSVVDSAESVITLTDELLDLAKIEAGKLEINPQPVEISSLLSELLRGQAARAEKRDRIFQAYSQGDSSTASLYGGTGLGLATSRRLAELMDGRLWFESEAGNGSTFLLALPYHPVESPVPPAWTQRQVLVDGRDILIVEDNPRLGELMRGWVAGWGGRPKLTASAAEVLAWAETGGRCAVAVVDFDLPHSQGLAILRSLGQQHPTPRLIVFTARPPEAKSGIEQYDILLKPLAPETLLECLSRPPRPPVGKPAGPAAPSSAPSGAAASAAAGAPASAHPAPAPATPAKPAAPPRARVVVADDDMVNQKVMRTYLERLGCEVRLASHGVEALALIASGPCDVLFLDIMMPRMDGLQAVREIRRVENERQAAGQTVRRLPVVAITAKVMPGDRENGLAAGFDDYATKPVNDARLRESLQKFIPSFQPPGPWPPAPRCSPPSRQCSSIGAAWTNSAPATPTPCARSSCFSSSACPNSSPISSAPSPPATWSRPAATPIPAPAPAPPAA